MTNSRFKLLFATDADELKIEMRMYSGHTNIIVEAETPSHAMWAKRYAILQGKKAHIVNEFLAPLDPAERHVIVTNFREAPIGTAVLIYVRPALASMLTIMRDHPEVRQEMDAVLSMPSDLL